MEGKIGNMKQGVTYLMSWYKQITEQGTGLLLRVQILLKAPHDRIL